MKVSVTKKQIEEVIRDLVEFKDQINSDLPQNAGLKYIKSYKEFLIDKKAKELISDLVNREKEFAIEVLVVESGHEQILQKSDLLLEWEQYKGIPQTTLTYRYDKGQGRVGMEDHIHVYLGNSKNQVYAINRSGTPHDESKAKLNNKEVKFLKSMGFSVPKDGMLEFRTLPLNKEYIGYKRQLLFD